MDEQLDMLAQEIEGEVVDSEVISPNGALHPMNRNGMMQVKTPYVTAVSGLPQRNLAKIERQVLQEAELLGDDAFYSWEVWNSRKKKNELVEGASINLAMVVIRCYGNCAVDQEPPVETQAAWFYPVSVVDLLTGFTHKRYGRYGRASIVYGKQDDERKERMRFEIGQSMAIRNAIDDFIPKWLMLEAIQYAKKGVRKRLVKYISTHSIEDLRQHLLDRLTPFSVTPAQVLTKMQRATVNALTLDDLVILQADVKRLENGEELADDLFGDAATKTPAGGVGGDTSEEPPKSPTNRTEQAKDQLKRTRADRAKNPSRPVYATLEQTEELIALADERGLREDLGKMFARTDPDKVTIVQYEHAKANLLTRPVLLEGETQTGTVDEEAIDGSLLNETLPDED